MKSNKASGLAKRTLGCARFGKKRKGKGGMEGLTAARGMVFDTDGRESDGVPDRTSISATEGDEPPTGYR
ncbi:MAG: hypothetical protein ISN28_09130 [Ectothiorhodospiraceae bacterium AqS1]|nr:hypothetical protein [Ectothiorhodospiraceae bacterium AqS1]